MKKYYLGLAALSFLAGLSSCLKDKNIDEQKYGMAGIENIKLIEFPADAVSIGLNASAQDTTFHLVHLRLNSAKPAQEDIKVTLVRNDQRVTDAHYEILPADRYTLGNLVVTIPKGSRDGYLDLTVAPDDLLDGAYAFAFDISAVPAPYTVSANFREVLADVITINQYDGIYRASGLIANHPTVSGPFSRELELVTTSATSVEFAQPNRSGLFGVYIDATVNANNTVSLTGSPVPYIPAGGQNHYDPVTRTFYLRFNWSGVPDRAATDTFVYLRPRF
ncbi:MAG: DUF1735 domain-containing protein [Sphingobacteriales bacterium]|nr:MAG: DUF1735 domain-containing protein [Sphingobacteriales bacterium]